MSESHDTVAENEPVGPDGDGAVLPDALDGPASLDDSVNSELDDGLTENDTSDVSWVDADGEAGDSDLGESLEGLPEVDGGWLGVDDEGEPEALDDFDDGASDASDDGEGVSGHDDAYGDLPGPKADPDDDDEGPSNDDLLRPPGQSAG